MIIRLLLGALIGGIIGFERELHGRAAGFRTQLLVCVAAVLIMVISENYYFHLHNLDSTLRIDPARISAGALMGIGFLGAGVIIKSGYRVRGLTTAASIWIVSAIGLAIGGGLYLEGILTFTITIIVLVVLRIVERKIEIVRFKTIIVSTPINVDNAEETIKSTLSSCGFIILSVDYEKNRSHGENTYSFTVSTKNKAAIKQIFIKLSSLEFINTLKIKG
ncbi:MAG: MgtC/SapB family protein [Thermodesulfovibrionia bacterium]|nr:MgtC/SapB family protein [Thermodesulfovibrionia bacterium]